MENHPIFQQICNSCGGKCCRTTIFMTRKEFQLLKERNDLIYHNSDGTVQLEENDLCPFLSDNCCSLPYEVRPLDCRIFPIAFLCEEDKLVIYKNYKCAYVDKIPQYWILTVKKKIEMEISHWTVEDKYRYSLLVSSQFELLEFYSGEPSYNI